MSKSSAVANNLRAAVTPRAQHPVSRKSISRAAVKVLYGLKDAGFQAHLVGGGVRDLLLGLEPKDFDVATDAHPEQIKAVFPNCRLIGRRFRLAHVRFGREIIEVATFRASHAQGSDGETLDDGRIVRDNVFGTIEEDALRRDFTANALYYNIADFSIIDYAGGIADIENKTLRMIGDPATRYREDPVRCLRAARFAAKLGFSIHPDTERPIAETGSLLREIPPARMFEEVLKLFQSGHAVASFAELRRLDLLKYLFPASDADLKAGEPGFDRLIDCALRNTDKRIAEEKPVTPAFIYAVMLWPQVQRRAETYQQSGEPPVPSIFAAADEVIARQLLSTSLPKRFSIPMREIWGMQPRLITSKGQRAVRLLAHPRFRAAYDFLCLREQAGEDLGDHPQRWTQMQESAPANEGVSEKRSGSRRRRRPRHKRGGASGNKRD
ncbi:MAG: polynucleotide adenylyltransferase PcnB [Pseudomonadota bacterium]